MYQNVSIIITNYKSHGYNKQNDERKKFYCPSCLRMHKKGTSFQVKFWVWNTFIKDTNDCFVANESVYLG